MKNMSDLLRTLAALAIAVPLIPAAVQAQDRDASLYAGTKSCKMCHKKDEEGAQFTKWEESAHSKAWANLASAESKEVAAKLGIDDPQTSGKCLKCHATAYNFTEVLATDKVPVEDGVSCESCHGPGKNYKKKEIMKDRDQAIAGGMIAAPKEHCTLCHNDQSPTWNPEKYTLADGTKAGFDAEQAYEKIKHPRPAAP